jgi:predicted ester cyclase
VSATEENKALIRRLVEVFQEYWRTGDDGLLDPLYAPGYVNHTPGMPPDLAGFKQAMPAFRAALPDLRLAAEDVVAEGDRVVLRLSARGTHTGALMGVPPTGNPVTITEMHLYRVAGGRFAERWGLFDAFGLLQQIGAIPGAEQRQNADPAPASDAAGQRPSVTAEESKALVRRFVDEVISRGNLAALDDLVGPDYVYHGPGMVVRGPAGLRGLMGMLRGGFPDWAEAVEDVVAEGDRVAFRVTGSGTHRGDFMGIPPSGARVAIMGIDLVRVAGGRIAEHWANFDQLGMLQQIGAVPAPGAPPAGAA